MLCWENGIAPQGQTNHIIQIGIAEVSTDTLTITRSKNYYIRPSNRDFDLTDYCQDLTGISKSLLVDEGHYFPEVMQSIKKQFGGNTPTFAWGDDYRPIMEHCLIYDVSNPWLEMGIDDFGILFRGFYNIQKKLPLKTALDRLHLKFEGCPHNAINDAVALSALYMETCKRVRVNKI
jgi:inhibitor of KinA sporulation pathway (predicted exonuclease)